MISMILDDVGVPPGLVKTIDVLGDYRVEQTGLLPIAPSPIWAGDGSALESRRPSPGACSKPFRITVKGAYLGVLHGIVLLPKALAAAKRRYACIHGDARARKGDYVPFLLMIPAIFS